MDDPGTWPGPLVAWADDWAERKRGATVYTGDLKIYEDDEVVRMLDGRLLRAYHCTRLLDHERAMIIEHGLVPLSSDLVMERIRRAHDAGAISDAERDAFVVGHQFALDDTEWQHRVSVTEKQVCVVTSRETFDHSADGVEPLLSNWGGEAIYFPLNREHGARLSSMGRPSIVVASVDLSVPALRGEHYTSPTLGSAFVGIRLGLDDRGSEILYRAAIPASSIDDIWHPGDREYDRHRMLPRR